MPEPAQPAPSSLPSAAPSRRRSLAALALLATVSLAGCNSSAPTGTAPTAAPTGAAPTGAIQPIASIKELMDSTVDAAADGVWDAVGVVVDAKGTTHNEPRTDEEWHAVRKHAVTLIESMNLVMLQGRPAAPAGAKPGLGELTPAQIDSLIAQNRPEFDQYATATRDMAVSLLQAIDKRDTAKMVDLGGTLDERCESCHVRFWYPDSPRPGK